MGVNAYLAFDLGAESGRAMLAKLNGDRVTLDAVHRFANRPQSLPSGYHWSLLDLWANLVEGLRKAGEHLAQEPGTVLRGVGVDTWGVDFGLVGKSNQLLGLPYAYRDERNAPAMRKAIDAVGEKAIYQTTGIQFMPFNSLYQLIAQRDAEPMVLDHAARLLFMPDLLHFFLSGQMVNEATIASTSQMIDPRSGQWATDLLESLGLPHHFLQPTVPAGTVIGPLRSEVAAAAGLAPIDVIVPGSHDTASAVAAVPVDADHASPFVARSSLLRSGVSYPSWAYLSSGTWSLMGAELDAPLISDASREAGFTNERGVGGKIRFLKNIAGLWLVQEVRRDFAGRGQTFEYAQLAKLAQESEPMRTLVDPAHEPFASPGGMRAKIDEFARSTGQPLSQTPGQYVRCCLESLALTYRTTMDTLEALLDRRIEILHIVGGGGKNTLLNQMTADALGRAVIVGPYEATALGNALTQAMGTGDVRDLRHLRAMVRASFEPVRYEPCDTQAYEAHRSRFDALCG